MNYNFRLISEKKPDTPEHIHSSNQMIAWGVWSELSKLSNITLHHYPSDIETSEEEWLAGLKEMPEVDFTLIHSYTPGPIFHQMDIVRAKTKHHVLWISECPFPGMDYCFTFLPSDRWGLESNPDRMEQLPLPTLFDVLDDSLIGVEKLPGSVLFDHAWGWVTGYDTYQGSVPNLWLDRYYEWFKDYEGVVGQMRSISNEERAHVTVPDWVQSIPHTSYTGYLKLTAPYENFIMTHVGSYEHSIIDMAARGIRVLVPTPTVPHYHRDGWLITQGGEPFAPRDTIERLNLKTFSSKEELFDILKTPIEASDRSKFTGTEALAGRIDSYCRGVLDESK